MTQLVIDIQNLLKPQPVKSLDNEEEYRQITQKSFEAYKSRLATLQRVSGNKSLQWVMQHPIDTLRQAKIQVSQNNATLASYAVAVCKLYQVHPETVLYWRSSYDMWQKYLKHYREKEQKQIKKSEMTERQAQNYVTWQEVEALFCKLQEDPTVWQDFLLGMEFLLFAMLLHIKPKRADLGNVKIFYALKEAVAYPGNCLYLAKAGNVKSKLFIKQYKTIKKNGIIEEILEPVITQVITKSLQTYPRQYLFVSIKNREPYELNNSYSKFVSRTFLKHFGKRMGVSLWRNVYIRANINFNNTSYQELVDTAKLIGHSVNEMFKTYRKIDMKPRPKEDQGKPVTCEDLRIKAHV